MTRHRTTTIAGILMAAAIVASCTVAGAPPSAERPTPTAPAAPTASPTPAPTPIPLDVLFLQRLPKTGSVGGTIAGSVTAGSQTMPIEGAFAFDDEDSQTVVVIGTGKDSTTVEQVTVAGRSYTRTANGPWLEQAAGKGRPGGGSPTSGAGSGLPSLLKALSALKTDGDVVRNGERLTRLVMPTTGVDPATLGFLPAGVRPSDFELAFLAKQDGTFAGITMSVRWSQVGAAGTTAMSMDIEFLVTSSPLEQRIERPEDVWVVTRPPGTTYSFAIPEAWEITPTSDGLSLNGPGADTIFIYSNAVPVSVTLKLWAGESEQMIKESGGRVTGNRKSTVAGVPAQLIFYDGIFDGVQVIGIDAAFVAAGQGYDIVFTTESGDAESQRVFSEQFLATFDIRGATTPAQPAQPQSEAPNA